jgi:DNA-directed RNA polymerase specialized sigma24 family protein
LADPLDDRRQPAAAGDVLRVLLARLGTDADRAAEAYERLREKLIRFFLARSNAEAEELADATLDRLGQRLAEGEAVQDVGRYAYGVARFVALQSTRRRQRRFDLLTRAAHSLEPGRPNNHSDPRFECLRRCWDRLGAEERRLLVEYYGEDGRALQTARRTLSQHLDIAPGALRVRVFRIRRQVEECAHHCLGASGHAQL